ncbi:MAG: ATP-binding cassette domain-containing protein [Treponema sp.]|nr:ATP-binding cassette domain-containing protein [Treponema sp.]
MALFEVKDVCFESRSKSIINGVSLKIEKGTVTALMGKSGSGKSTLLKLMAGLLVPSSGHVYYDGVDIQHMTHSQNMRFRKNCSFIFQDSALWENQNVLQNLELPVTTQYPHISDSEKRALVDEVCHKVNYTKSLLLRPAELSMGEQKLIAYARAVINKPDVLFLDECTESLDKNRRAVIIQLLHEFVNEGNTVVYITHDSTFIAEFPGEMYVLEEGALSE